MAHAFPPYPSSVPPDATPPSTLDIFHPPKYNRPRTPTSSSSPPSCADVLRRDTTTTFCRHATSACCQSIATAHAVGSPRPHVVEGAREHDWAWLTQRALCPPSEEKEIVLKRQRKIMASTSIPLRQLSPSLPSCDRRHCLCIYARPPTRPGPGGHRVGILVC